MAFVRVRKTGGSNAGTEIQVDANSGFSLKSGAYLEMLSGGFISGGDGSHIDVTGTGEINVAHLYVTDTSEIQGGGSLAIKANATLSSEGDSTIAWAGTLGHLCAMSFNAYTSMTDAGTWTHSATHTVTGTAGILTFASGGNIAGDPLFKSADVVVDNASTWEFNCPINLAGNLGFVNQRVNGGDILTDGVTITVTQKETWDYSQPNISNAKMTLGGVPGRNHKFDFVYTYGSSFDGFVKWDDGTGNADRVKFNNAVSIYPTILHMEAIGESLRLLGIYDRGGHATVI